MKLLNTDMGPAITFLAFLGILDALVTGLGLVYGWFGELNPLLNWAWIHHGISGFLGLKFSIIFLTSLVFTFARTKVPATTDKYCRVAGTLYLLILSMGIGSQLI